MERFPDLIRDLEPNLKKTPGLSPGDRSLEEKVIPGLDPGS